MFLLKNWSNIVSIPLFLNIHKLSWDALDAQQQVYICHGNKKPASKFSVKAATTLHGFSFRLMLAQSHGDPALSLCVLKQNSITVLSSVIVSTLFSSIVIWTVTYFQKSGRTEADNLDFEQMSYKMTNEKVKLTKSPGICHSKWCSRIY